MSKITDAIDFLKSHCHYNLGELPENTDFDEVYAALKHALALEQSVAHLVAMTEASVAMPEPEEGYWARQQHEAYNRVKELLAR